MFEICCFNTDAALAAIRGGAKRIELCNNRQLDGITPTNENGEIDVVWREAHAGPSPRCAIQLMLRPTPQQQHLLKQQEGQQPHQFQQSMEVEKQAALVKLLCDSSAFFAAPLAPQEASGEKEGASYVDSIGRTNNMVLLSNKYGWSTTLEQLVRSAKCLWPVCDGFVIGYLCIRVGPSLPSSLGIDASANDGKSNSGLGEWSQQPHPAFPLTDSIRALLGIDGKLSGDMNRNYTHWWLDVDWELLSSFFASMSQHSNGKCATNDIKEKSLTFHRAIDCLFRQEELYCCGFLSSVSCYRKHTHLADALERLRAFHFEMSGAEHEPAANDAFPRTAMQFDRILTSGGPPKAIEGAEAIRDLLGLLAEKGSGPATTMKSLAIMLGGGVTPSVAAQLRGILGYDIEFHGSLLDNAESLLPNPDKLEEAARLC